MMLWQLAPDSAVYGEHAGWWLVVTDDGDRELAGPYSTQAEAEAERLRLTAEVSV